MKTESKEISFSPRGIGGGSVRECFICGATENINHDLASFVISKEDGEEAIKMFDKGAWLDFRPHEPTWIQVKVGACDAHLVNLRLLLRTIKPKNFISVERVNYAKGL